jgi:hypothetical protein
MLHAQDQHQLIQQAMAAHRLGSQQPLDRVWRRPALHADWVNGAALSMGSPKGRGEAARATVVVCSLMGRFMERSAMWGGGREDCGWDSLAVAVIFSRWIGVVARSVAVCSGIWIDRQHTSLGRRQALDFTLWTVLMIRMGLSRSFYISLDNQTKPR